MISLPVDIYVHILEHLPVDRTGDTSSINTLVSCCKANSVLRAAATVSSIWRPHYHVQYTVAVQERETDRRTLHNSNWRLMFYDRRRLDYEARKLLADIIAQHSNRDSRTQDLCRLSYDVWNALENETRRPLPEIFRGAEHDTDSAAPLAPHALTRKFWAQKMLGVIARHHTICLWAKSSIGSPDSDLTFEEALAGLSTFFDYSPWAVRV